jgi:glutaredoxin
MQGTALVFATPTCGHCRVVKQVLARRQIPVTTVMVTEATRPLLQQLVGAEVRSVPQVFFNTCYVGGAKAILDLDGADQLPTHHLADPMDRALAQVSEEQQAMFRGCMQ